LAQSYARLGMSNAFRGTAASLLEGGDSRYAPILRLQLLLDAYRSGAYQEAASLTGAAQATDPGLASLVGGLANYRLGNWTAARTGFDAAAAAGGPYAGYARYMSAL